LVCMLVAAGFSLRDCEIPKGGSVMKYGARNQLMGDVIEIKEGTLMCQVKVNLPAESTVSSVMTLDSLHELGINRGDKVKAIIKAVNVLLVKEEV